MAGMLATLPVTLNIPMTALAQTAAPAPTPPAELRPLLPAARLLGSGVCAQAMAEVRVGVVHGGRAMGGPAGVGSAGGTVDVFGGHLLQQLSHAGGAAGALQACRARCIEAGGMYRHAAGVIAPVFKPLQALDEDGNDVARGNRADDAAHGVPPCNAM